MESKEIVKEIRKRVEICATVHFLVIFDVIESEDSVGGKTHLKRDVQLVGVHQNTSLSNNSYSPAEFKEEKEKVKN